jgi:hypothetical protein
MCGGVGSSTRHIDVSRLCNGDGVLREVRAAGKLTPGDLNIAMEHDQFCACRTFTGPLTEGKRQHGYALRTFPILKTCRFMPSSHMNRRNAMNLKQCKALD